MEENNTSNLPIYGASILSSIIVTFVSMLYDKANLTGDGPILIFLKVSTAVLFAVGISFLVCKVGKKEE